MKYHVYYAGEKFIFDKDPFESEDFTEPGSLKVRQSNGNFVTFALGPGIPIVVKEVKPSTRTAGRIL